MDGNVTTVVATTATTSPVITDWTVSFFLGILALVVIYFIIREFRIMRTSSRKIEADLERDKLKVLQQEAEAKAYPFTRLSPDQVAAIKQVEDDNTVIEVNLFAKERLLDTRMKRLEYYVKQAKLDNMLGKVAQEEKKVK
jgi:flagellar biosynthesis/type III secretory pathway M-ring protein FliF/YscJ